MEEERQATTVRLTRRQLKWIKDEAFERRCSQQDVIEAALVGAGAPGVSVFVSSIQAAEARIAALDHALVAMVADGHDVEAAIAFDRLRAAAARLGVSSEDLVKSLPQYAEALK